MEEKIKIGCPNCGAALTVKRVEGIEGRRITCPACMEAMPFTSFKLRQTVEENAHTQSDETKEESKKPLVEETNKRGNIVLGRICVLGATLSFQLHEGRNLIGRKAVDSSAQIQIPCMGRRTSREHLVIDVRKIPNVGYVHYASLNKEQVNPTYIDNRLLKYGDEVVLKHNSVIKLPDTEIRLEIPDED